MTKFINTELEPDSKSDSESEFMTKLESNSDSDSE